MKLLEVKNLHANVNDKEIISGLNLDINKGEIHVIMGPNGAGKSTLANVILNNPEYKITNGQIKMDGELINNMKTDEIAKKGVFMSFQSPEEIPGITVLNFLRTAKNKISNEYADYYYSFSQMVNEYMKELDIKESYISRNLNVGFSGGEKKKNEILQMLVLNPKLAILDETDSGLDVDAIKTVSKGIKMFSNKDNAVLIITHNTKLIEDLNVDYVHILVNGKIVHTGDKQLANIIEKDGYSSFIK